MSRFLPLRYEVVVAVVVDNSGDNSGVLEAVSPTLSHKIYLFTKARGEADGFLGWFRGELFHFVDLLSQEADDGGVPFLCGFELLHAGGQVFVSGQHFPEFDESPDDEDVHFHSPFAVQDGGEHGHAVLGESVW
jgi:hypothetical protein